MGMKTLKRSTLNALPPLYSQEEVSDPIVRAKFFTPWTDWTWYAIEFDGEDTFFGKVVSPLCPEGEFGNFSLSELTSLKGPFGLEIECDKHFEPMSLSQALRLLAVTSKGF